MHPLIGAVILCALSSAVTAVTLRFLAPSPVERLKNALLTLLLMRTGVRDEGGRRDYMNFDGTKLPMLSGASIENACFSYILSPHDRAFGPWRSSIMDEKHAAIDRYLAKNLSTAEDVLVSFHAFTQHFIPQDQLPPRPHT